MNDNDRRNTEDFYVHRKEVLKRIQHSLEVEKLKKKARKKK